MWVLLGGAGVSGCHTVLLLLPLLLLRAKRVSPKGEVTAQGVVGWQRCVVAEIHTINPRDFE